MDEHNVHWLYRCESHDFQKHKEAQAQLRNSEYLPENNSQNQIWPAAQLSNGHIAGPGNKWLMIEAK